MAKTQSTTPIYHGRRWPVGITNAAKRLGCSAPHLLAVLRGERTSPRITQGYEALIVELKGGAPQ